MKISEWLEKAVQKLETASVPTARLDAEVLLADELKKDRSWLHAHPHQLLQGDSLQKLEMLCSRRAKHEPLAYIRGKQEFYGRDFIVSPDTLTPRPETETMLDLLIQQVSSFRFPVSSSSKPSSYNSKLKTQNSKLSVVDVGTGSGCIIITAALELAQLSNINYQISYLGLDISEPALKIAKQNAKYLKANVEFKKFDLLKGGLFSIIKYQISNIILANLPYVPDNFEINLAASHEPEFAIFGGGDGLDLYRELFSQLGNTSKSQIILTESLPPQHAELQKIAQKAGFTQIDKQDFIQVFERSR